MKRGRKKSKREYILCVIIEGVEYYVYGLGKIYNYYGEEIRLTKNINSAQKLKTKSLLKRKIEEIKLHNNLEFKIKGKTLATSCDIVNRFKKIKDDIKKSEENLEKLKIEFSNLNVRSTLNYQRIIEIGSEISKNIKNIFDNKKRLKDTKIREKKVEVEFKILDASFNFRYSKLKKLLSE
ncbi:hypothetical protein K9M42_03220 [Patescibacteria group bacterium]|nr:hypothetical protein [Patescibacteria group bacterium]